MNNATNAWPQRRRFTRPPKEVSPELASVSAKVVPMRSTGVDNPFDDSEPDWVSALRDVPDVGPASPQAPTSGAVVAPVERKTTPVTNVPPTVKTGPAKTRQNRENVLAAPLRIGGRVAAANVGKDFAEGGIFFDALPNSLFRSALFGCATSNGRNRNYVDSQPVASTSQYEMRYTGRLLDACDAEVFMLCCAASRSTGGIGQTVGVSLREWNAALGKACTGPNDTWLKASLKRLYDANVTIVRYESGPDRSIALAVRRVRFLARFDEDILHDGQRRVHRVSIQVNPEILPLFEADGTEIDFTRVTGLSRSLDKWLHNMYSTHSTPVDVRIETLKLLSGTPDSTSMADFKKALKKAVAALQTCSPPLFAQGTGIDSCNKLHVVKASNSRVLGAKKKTGQAADKPASRTRSLIL